MTGSGDRDERIVGAIDIGSNTVRLHIARTWIGADGEPRFETMVKRSEVTRLAEGVDARGILLPQAITRTRIALTDYNRALHEAGAVLGYATATSAVRDADNGEAFLGELEHSYGFRTELLSGDDEARTTFAGVTSDPELREQVARATTTVLDIGGGSTEIVTATHGEIARQHSFQLGSVRLTEQLSLSESPDPEELQSLDDHVEAMFRAHDPAPERPALLVGVAGTVTTAATFTLGLPRYDAEKIHLAELELDDVLAVRDRLAAMSEAERAALPQLEAKRAGVIVAGVSILVAAMRWWRPLESIVSERDILDGIMLRAARMAHDEGLDELPQPFGNAAC